MTTAPPLLDRAGDAGLDLDALEALRARIRREVDDGLTPAAQMAFAVDGELVLYECFGSAGPATRFNLFSATKPVVVGAVWQLIAEGRLDISRRVAEFIPEFATNGKDVVTVEQVLLHTSGFPTGPLGPPAWFTREGRLAAFERWRLNWEPGTRYEYHPTSAHWVLAELIERIDGRDYRESVRERVVAPLGLPMFLLGAPPEQQGEVAELVAVGEPLTAEQLRELLGIDNLQVGEVTPDALLLFNDPANRAVGVPGGGGLGTAADLALYFQHVLHNTGGLWDAEVLADARGNVRNRLPDPLLRVPASRTLGLVVAGDDGMASFRGPGATVGPRTFGHNGAAGQIAWCDPDTGVSFGFTTAGVDRNVVREATRIVSIGSKAGNASNGRR